MIGKVITGSSFRGCVNYNLEKVNAMILAAEGVRTASKETMIADFNLQRAVNTGLGKAVGHIALAWSPNDKDKLNDNIMVERAMEYMEKMKIRDTQYFIVKHQDKTHPHLHIIYNRVNNNGQTISDKFQRKHNQRVCKELTLKYGYHLAKGKEHVNVQNLKGIEKIRHELYVEISKALKQCNNWRDLDRRLRRQGIELQFKYKGGSEEIQGISFARGEVKFKGSKIDRSLSYGNITKQLEINKALSKEQKLQIKPSLKQTSQQKQQGQNTNYDHKQGQGQYLDIALSLLNSKFDREDYGPEMPKKKKREKGQQQDQGLSL